MDEHKGTPTSGNREESMEESGNDAFGGKKPVRDATSQGDGSSKTGKPGEADEEKGDLDPATSGTASLGGEPHEGDALKGPGGVEGEGGGGPIRSSGFTGMFVPSN